MALHVVSMNLGEVDSVFILSNDEIIPITNYYDDDGDEVRREDDFQWMVAGPSVEGYWFTEQIDHFELKRPS